MIIAVMKSLTMISDKPLQDPPKQMLQLTKSKQMNQRIACLPT